MHLPTGWRRRGAAVVLGLMAIAALLLRPIEGAVAEQPGPQVHVLVLEGVISPVSARYVVREVRAAHEARATALVVQLDTPGGLERSMRVMTSAFLGSSVPVVVHVAPPGARAASAGLFITLAAHVAAMSPGTSIGAAHPVALGGGDDTVADKVAADAAAFARSLAELRGRDPSWAERAVFESVSASEVEALATGTVDLVAADLPDLLAQIDGLAVATAAGEVRLQTAGARIVERPMSLVERLLQAITNPNVAYVLFTVGLIGLAAELYSPGSVFPGITGLISLVLAFVAFGSLPVSWAGIALLLLGLGLFLLDVVTEGLGVLAVAGIVGFVLGSLLLYQPITPASPALPAVRVSPWLIAAMAAFLAAMFLIVLRALVASRRAPVTSGTQALVGRVAVATTPLAPEGSVRLDGEHWTAVAEGGSIPAGAEVEVVNVRGVRLTVRSRAPSQE